MAVKVQFQIGHSSKLRSKKTVEGFTHDWELYVKGVQQADISAFVEKIIFNLHESFQKPKRVCSKPPYVIQESGYAGFIVFIDIYFRNRDEPKKVQFNYDLDLQQTGPPQHRHDVKTFIFDNPSEEYRLKLLKGGGVPVSGVVPGLQPTIANNIAAMPTQIGVNHSPGECHKTLLSEGKKHKTRPDDGRSNSFANLFGTPITKTSAVVGTTATKHSPDNKVAVVPAHASHQPSAAANVTAAKEKASKDKEKSSEKSKERSEKRDKHYKQSLNSPHKEGGRSGDSKKTDKNDKRDRAEEKSKKDKNRDRERERDREKSSGANAINSTNSKKPSPKPGRDHSPHKSIATGIMQTNSVVNNTNSVPRPSSSNSGKLEESKAYSKPAKDLCAESKSKESKQKESSSSSSGKKSKKEKKDKDKDKERDKEKRHEEREKQKLTENQQRPGAKEDANKLTNNINAHSNNANSLDNKNSKSSTNPAISNMPNDIAKKSEKFSKQELFKTGSDKMALTNMNTTLAPTSATANSSCHTSADKKSSSSSSLNSNSNPPEKDKRSHKHKKKEKNKDKDKDKDRERDKEREKDKDKERDKDKDKEKEKEKDAKREKENKEKHAEEKATEPFSTSPQNTNGTKSVLANPAQEQFSTLSTSAASNNVANNASSYTTASTTTAIPLSSFSATANKSSKNKDKKSKDKSATKEEKLKRKANDFDGSESKAKQSKISSNNSVLTSSSLSTSSSSSSVSTSLTNATTNLQNPNQTAAATGANSVAETNLNLDLSDTDSSPSASVEQMTNLVNSSLTKPSLQPSPIITHSESSNSSFPDLQLSKQQPQCKPAASRESLKSLPGPAAASVTATTSPLLTAGLKEPQKASKAAAKDKTMIKPPKEDDKEKKRRRNSQAANTFIEPPSKQLKTKEQPKSVREKSKSPLLRSTGSRNSISTEASNTFLQPSVSPSSTAAAAPLPPPSSAPSASHSPALSATEAVGNATSATANAATCNSNTTPSSTTNSAGMAAPHQLPLDYLSELQELHHQIMTLQDNEDLQHVVELIAATGCYEITTKTFDFDLCKLDRSTVQRLQEFFATSVS